MKHCKQCIKIELQVLNTQQLARTIWICFDECSWKRYEVVGMHSFELPIYLVGRS